MKVLAAELKDHELIIRNVLGAKGYYLLHTNQGGIIHALLVVIKDLIEIILLHGAVHRIIHVLVERLRIYFVGLIIHIKILTT